MNRLVVALALFAASISSVALAQTPAPSSKKLCGSDVATYLAAAQKGDGDAMFCMGVKHSNSGTEVTRDDVQATRWFMKAADAGHPGGMFFTGVAFWSGRGISQDTVEAYKWLDLSAKLGSQSAITARDGLTRVLSPQNIGEAQQRAADWENGFQKRKKS